MACPNDCKHEVVKYCSKCLMVHCEKCGKNWASIISSIPYYNPYLYIPATPYSPYYHYYTDYKTSGGAI